MQRPLPRHGIFRLLFVLLVVLAAASSCGRPHDLRAYIALDQEHSERLVQQFMKETGLTVDDRYDTEASKTVGLVAALIEEQSRPRCDVFWNNELAQTVRLGQKGVLAEYVSKSADGIPQMFKAKDGTWTGFAARARILIVNEKLVPESERPSSMWDLLDPKWKGKAAVAVPLNGTTLTHFTALRVLLGEEEFTRFLDGLEQNDVELMQGNGATMLAVAEGRKHFAFTDTDDYHVARTRGFDVTCVFPDQEEGQIGTMLIPNSISLISGCPNPEAGKEFIDWVLRAETEALLAAAKSAQIPVREGIAGPADRSILGIGSFRPMAWDADQTAAALAEASAFLAERFNR